MRQVVVVKTMFLQVQKNIVLVKNNPVHIQKVHSCGANLFFCRFKRFMVIIKSHFLQIKSVDEPLHSWHVINTKKKTSSLFKPGRFITKLVCH